MTTYKIYTCMYMHEVYSKPYVVALKSYSLEFMGALFSIPSTVQAHAYRNSEKECFPC